MSITTTTGVNNIILLLPRRYGHEFRVLSEHLLIVVAISIVIVPPWYNDHCIAVIGVTIVTVTTTTANTT
jgi:hypothetical protein